MHAQQHRWSLDEDLYSQPFLVPCSRCERMVMGTEGGVVGGWMRGRGDHSECSHVAFFTDAAQTPVLSKIGYTVLSFHKIYYNY